MNQLPHPLREYCGGRNDGIKGSSCKNDGDGLVALKLVIANKILVR
jgi:hypothetical protein